jgi:murein DD-endopeptidase MepM/ murein hydrolase activator NlpD
LPFRAKILRFLLWFSVSIIISLFYFFLFEKKFGSPEERILAQKLENMKLQYNLLGKEMDKTLEILNSFKLSDDSRYRPILGMESIPETYRKGGFGGVERFQDIKGFMNSSLLLSYRTKIEEIRNMANVQRESFTTIEESAKEWKRQVDHFPGISPVSVNFRLGDGYVFRAIHPVLGTPRMHNGQDFKVPYGTEVFATGDGIVVESGYSSGGFGNYVVIDHDYGLSTLYGHLSEIKVPRGTNVKRGDLIGISGNTGLSSGPHLHYQVEQKGHTINPRNFFNDDMTIEEYNEMIQAFGSRSKFR